MLTSCLFTHTTRKMNWRYVLMKFGIKYYLHEDLQYSITTKRIHYDISIDHLGGTYCGFQLERYYHERYHPLPSKPQYSTHKSSQPMYSTTEYEYLDKKSKCKIELIIGTFLYYGRCVEPNILTALKVLQHIHHI